MIRVKLALCLVGVTLLGTLAGCRPEDPEPANGASAVPRAAVTLRVAVIDDEPLRRAIDRLRGEWQTLTDGQIETFAATLDSADAKQADLIVFPSRSIGELCEAGVLRPVREGVLRSETLRYDDFLPLVRDHEVVYAQRVMALPIGCPTPLHLAPNSGENSLAKPEEASDTTLALSFLAWAAPHSVHRSRTATLFDSDTFQPRLAEPPFVRALEQFVPEPPTGIGRIVWPSRQLEVGFQATPQLMPAAAEAFNPMSDQWEVIQDRGKQFATLLASSGRLIGVTTNSRNAATAFRFAAWLVGPDNARMLATSSDNVANCRGSLARATDPWFAGIDRDTGKAFASTSAEALRASRFLFAPRLPGADEYLAALGANVRSALEGQPPAEALAEAAAAWGAISERRGLDTQREAYFRSINARPFPGEAP